MPGRNGLTWVTALTIASLLIGSGALNALAEGRGGGDHGGASGRGNAGHQQQAPTVINQSKHEGEGNGSSSNYAAAAAVQASNTDKNHDGNGNNADNKRNDDDNNNVDRKPDDDNEDLVTPPARVTDDVHPGQGCGDQNHEHERHDDCKKQGGNGDNDGGAVDDDVNQLVTAVVDDSAGD